MDCSDFEASINSTFGGQQSFKDRYILSVAPPDIQLFDVEGLERIERIKDILEEEIP